MMGKRKLCMGITVGAIIGGLTALTNSGVRSFTAHKINKIKSDIGICLKDPTQSVKDLKACAKRLNTDVTNGLEGTINALEQVEKTLEKVIPKKDPIKDSIK